METSGDNSITVVDPHVETYADTNLNEKNLGTQYIYTTEGQLIPASEDHTNTDMDLNSEHYNTVHVTEGIHIQQVDYSYEQQYPDGTVQQVVPVSGTEFVQDSSNTYMIDQESYVTQSSQATEEQVYTSESVTRQQTSTYEYSSTTTTEVKETYIAEQPVVSESQVSNELATDSMCETTTQEKVENENQVDEVEPIETVTESTKVVSENAEPVVSDAVPVLEDTADNTVETVPDEIAEAVDMKEEVALSTVEEDQANLENLKSNPAIEIQNEESMETSEESVQESENVEATKTEKSNEQNVGVTEEHEVPTEVQETTVNEGSEAQEVTESEENPVLVAEIAAEAEVENAKESTPRPRGRKPKTDIPLHILGHDVNKPMENFVNGKTPKPRLGVKVPYRNLTSQIVSKAEIEKEILDRGRKKQEEKKAELSFARQLTSRLAQKIAPENENASQKTSKPSKNKDEDNADNSKDNEMDVDSNANEENIKQKPKDSIDNSDLLAILEGDVDTEDISELAVEPLNKESTPTDETNLKNLEREIALQQLQDLPYLSPKTKFVKSNKMKELPSGVDGKSTSSGHQVTSTVKPQTPKSPIKSNVQKLDVEPQIKVNMALKTYSRKRKSSDGVAESLPSPSKKTNVEVSTEEIDIKPSSMQPPAPGPIYVTKSSRIIKKKVIWDPDETAPSRSKPSPVKADANLQPKTPIKSAHPKNESKPADLPKKSAAEVKARTDKKVEEKPTPKKTTNAEKRTSPGTPKQTVKPKKPKSEVDRLLEDEGAINMLYELKNSDTPNDERRRKSVFSVAKTFKELAKKADQIKSDLVSTSTAETPKSLRKKDPNVSPISAQKPPAPVLVSTPVVPGGISRQKSKDSARSTPPPSPAFSFPNEVSYLIRRRSSSSISSGNDTGGSLDFDDTEERLSKKKPISTSIDPLKIKKSKKSSESEKSRKRAENRIGHYKTFHFKKTNKSITIDLHIGNSTGCYFTSELLDELTTALSKISKEKDCNVVLIRSSSEKVFSHGLNYKYLVSEKESTRKNKASELADRVRNFIECLIGFPKILVAGIQGQCEGLAVTMLPLFDIVIASDDARFSTSYSSLGCVAEAGFLLTVPFVSNYGLAGELLYASQTLTADEACRRGLISKLCWPEKYQETLKSTLVAVAQGSKQSLEAMKNQLRSSTKQSSEEVIDSMVTELVEHWTSSECQSNFAKIE